MKFKPRCISIVQWLNIENLLSGRCYLHLRWYFYEEDDDRNGEEYGDLKHSPEDNHVDVDD